MNNSTDVSPSHVQSPVRFHENAVAAILTARDTVVDGKLIRGIAPNCKIMPVVFWHDSLGGKEEAVIMLNKAVKYVISKQLENPDKRFIINLSYGFNNYFDVDSIALVTKLDSCEMLDIPVFISAGNQNTNVKFPANLDKSSAVTLTTDNATAGVFDQIDFTRTSGEELDFGTPGSLTTVWGGNTPFAAFHSTSAACPQAAGVAALLLSYDNNLTVQEVREILRTSADKIDSIDANYQYDEHLRKHSIYIGYGLINAYRALDKIELSFTNDAEGVQNTGQVKVNQNILNYGNSRSSFLGEVISYEPGDTLIQTPTDLTKFYRWNVFFSNSERDYYNEFLFAPFMEEYSYTINSDYKKTKPLTVRNLLEGSIEGGDIWFGERNIDERNVISGHTEDAFIYQHQTVEAKYLAEATDVIADVAGTNWKFLSWENGSTNRIRDNIQVSEQTPSIMSAIYKGSLRSGTTSALRGPSQRKIARTSDGTLHIVYESMGKVWYEINTINEWLFVPLINENEPIIPLSNGQAKYPAITVRGNNSLVVYQENVNGQSDIVIKYFYSNYAESEKRISTSESYGIDLTPVLSFSTSDELMVIWRESTGLKYAVCSIVDSQLSNPIDIGSIPNTTSASLNPSIAGIYNSGLSSTQYHIVWQEGNNSIKYVMYYDGGGQKFFNVNIISNGSGYDEHWNPEVTVVNQLPVAGWAAKRTQIGELPGPIQTKTNAFGGGGGGTQIIKRGVIRKQTAYGIWSSTFTSYGDNILDISLNTAGGAYGFTFSGENEFQFDAYSLATKGITSYAPTAIYNISSDGGFYFLSNGISTNNMTGLDIDLVDQLDVNDPPFGMRVNNPFSLSKVSSKDSIYIGREGITTRDSIQFYFTFGEIFVNGNQIFFTEIPDTLNKINNTQKLNKFLESEPFAIDDNSVFTYGMMCGLADSLDQNMALEKNEYINFKIELLDDHSKQVLGVYNEITFTSEDTSFYSNKNYNVELKGVGNKTARLRLRISDNFKQEYTIGNLFIEDTLIYKKSYQNIHFKGDLLVKDYDLVQNYPNPFNPATTIKDQIPKSGHVKLRVYDILGREVTTLVNEYLEDGRYEAVFNANELSSGVYIYRLEVNDFVTSKKMMLVK